MPSPSHDLEEFEEYAEKAKTWPESTTNENKLILYGLYKQATVGNVNTGKWVPLHCYHWPSCPQCACGFLPTTNVARHVLWMGLAGYRCNSCSMTSFRFKLVSQTLDSYVIITIPDSYALSLMTTPIWRRSPIHGVPGHREEEGAKDQWTLQGTGILWCRSSSSGPKITEPVKLKRGGKKGHGVIVVDGGIANNSGLFCFRQKYDTIYSSSHNVINCLPGHSMERFLHDCFPCLQTTRDATNMTPLREWRLAVDGVVLDSEKRQLQWNTSTSLLVSSLFSTVLLLGKKIEQCSGVTCIPLNQKPSTSSVPSWPYEL